MELYVNPQITGFRQDVDGTIKELKIGSNKEDAYANIVEQGGKKLDNNKTATINVSTYTEPVEILPTEGKDGMKKATITLSNIPSGDGSGTLYCWAGTGDFCYTTTPTPTTSDKALASGDNTTIIAKVTITSVSAEGITISPTGDDVYERDPTGDILIGDTSLTFYAWSLEGGSIMFTLSATPSVGDNAYYESEDGGISDTAPAEIASVGEGTITVSTDTFSRASASDITYSKS